MRSALTSALLLATFVVADAQAQQASGCDDLSGRAIHPAVDWQLDVKPIFTALVGGEGRCTGCHNAVQSSAGLDLSDTDGDAIYRIVDEHLVVPGRPRESLLFLKVNCAEPPSGSRMPLGDADLSILQQELIHDWIAQGAHGEPGAPIARRFVFRGGFEALR